jgi:hypothetical protein
MRQQFTIIQTNLLLTGRQLSAEIPSSKEGYRAFIQIWGYRSDPAHPFRRRLSPVLTDDHSDAQFTLHIFEVSQADLDAQFDLDDVLTDLAYYQGLPDLETVETLLSDYLANYSILTTSMKTYP